MKRFIWIPIFCVLLLCGCAHPTSNESTETTQTAIEDTNANPTEVPEEENIPDMVEDAAIEGFVVAHDQAPWQIRTRKYRNDETDYIGYALHIEVDTCEKILKKVLVPAASPTPGGSRLFLGDIDGDGTQEILVHYDTGGCGGFGSYLSWVLKVENDEIRVLFFTWDEFDTGFESRFLEGYRLEVKNNITGYTLVYDVKDRYGEYLDASDKLPDGNFMVDSFCIFEPKDTDGDGISEILCKQYTSIRMHADYTGIACSVLKFNKETQVFEVIDAWYEPNTET